VADAQGMRDQVIQLGAQAGSAWAFFEPEVLTMDAAAVDKWIASTPG
jgi:oligoendopeptidase F